VTSATWGRQVVERFAGAAIAELPTPHPALERGGHLEVEQREGDASRNLRMASAGVSPWS